MTTVVYSGTSAPEEVFTGPSSSDSSSKALSCWTDDDAKDESRPLQKSSTEAAVREPSRKSRPKPRRPTPKESVYMRLSKGAAETQEKLQRLRDLRHREEGQRFLEEHSWQQSEVSEDDSGGSGSPAAQMRREPFSAIRLGSAPGVSREEHLEDRVKRQLTLRDDEKEQSAILNSILARAIPEEQSQRAASGMSATSPSLLHGDTSTGAPLPPAFQGVTFATAPGTAGGPRLQSVEPVRPRGVLPSRFRTASSRPATSGTDVRLKRMAKRLSVRLQHKAGAVHECEYRYDQPQFSSRSLPQTARSSGSMSSRKSYLDSLDTYASAQRPQHTGLNLLSLNGNGPDSSSRPTSGRPSSSRSTARSARSPAPYDPSLSASQRREVIVSMLAKDRLLKQKKGKRSNAPTNRPNVQNAGQAKSTRQL